MYAFLEASCHLAFEMLALASFLEVDLEKVEESGMVDVREMWV